MTKNNDNNEATGEFILYQTEDGHTRIECRFENETIWLTQALMAELFQVTVPTVNEHLKGIYADQELRPEATIRNFRIVRREGSRQVSRDIEHYNLQAILAVGFRVRSHRGTQFRQWATAQLRVSNVMELDPLKVSCWLNERPTTVYGKVLWPEQAMREAVAVL